jgi:hypothetical protein
MVLPLGFFLIIDMVSSGMLRGSDAMLVADDAGLHSCLELVQNNNTANYSTSTSRHEKAAREHVNPIAY